MIGMPKGGELKGKAKDGDMVGWGQRARREQVPVGNVEGTQDLVQRAARVAMQKHLATVSRRHRQARRSILMCGALAVELVSSGSTRRHARSGRCASW